MKKNFKQNKQFRFAFTLAEIIIVVGIIGIIAELTIPTLLANVQNQVNIAGAKEAYAIISQAYTMSIAENGTPDTWNFEANTGTGAVTLMRKITPYLKISKDCGPTSDCIPSTGISTLSGNPWIVSSYNFGASAKLQNGMDILIYTDDTNCGGTYNRCGWFLFDINGDKSPNILGKDSFLFEIKKEGVYPFGTKNTLVEKFDNACLKTGDYIYLGAGCAAWVIYNGNQDYLKSCGTTLSWSGPTSCN